MTLAKNIEEAGASIINTGIGWHEARIPTIATSVPRAGFSWVTKKLKGEVGVGTHDKRAEVQQYQCDRDSGEGGPELIQYSTQSTIVTITKDYDN